MKGGIINSITRLHLVDYFYLVMELLQRKFHGVEYNISYPKHQAGDFRRCNCVLCLRFFQAPTHQNSECNRQTFLNNKG
jgi:hypothetical protein